MKINSIHTNQPVASHQAALRASPKSGASATQRDKASWCMGRIWSSCKRIGVEQITWGWWTKGSVSLPCVCQWVYNTTAYRFPSKAHPSLEVYQLIAGSKFQYSLPSNTVQVPSVQQFRKKATHHFHKDYNADLVRNMQIPKNRINKPKGYHNGEAVVQESRVWSWLRCCL